ncbi:MAG: hypothetical protein PHQ40_17680 [Anaerolineaceae bacterium]|nr:hypothetical protein [Anaerolineaceae bacterium]
MRVEIVADKMPLSDRWVRSKPALDVFDKIFLVACLLGSAGNKFATGNIEIAGKRQRTVSEVFKLAPFDFSWAHRQAWMFALQRLYTGHFIQTFCALTLLSPFTSCFVYIIDVCNLLIKTVLIAGCQPITVQVRLEISFFLKTRRMTM